MQPLVHINEWFFRLDRYCGDFKESDQITSKDGEPIIVVFKTDLIVGGHGFEFSWETT